MSKAMSKTLRVLVLLFTLCLSNSPFAGGRFITLASTTSTDNSGLFAILLPTFTRATGIAVRVVAVGTGKAIILAQNGDADVLLVHHKPCEEKFVSEGFGVTRYDVMYNDFVLVGPGSDRARIRDAKDIVNALRTLAKSDQPFASRGDDSGTHKKELSLWKAAGIDVNAASGKWYRETGSGMGATLNVASGLNAYALTDRATWLKFKNKGELELLFEGGGRLFNQYGVIGVSEKKHPHIKAKDAQQFIDWLISTPGQEKINAFTINNRQVFFANASK